MLKLARRPGESIVINLPDGQTIVVLVYALHGKQVRLGIDAPKEVEILRQELVSNVERKNA